MQSSEILLDIKLYIFIIFWILNFLFPPNPLTLKFKEMMELYKYTRWIIDNYPYYQSPLKSQPLASFR